MRNLALFWLITTGLLLVFAGISKASRNETPVPIYVVNNSTYVSNDELANSLSSFQISVSRDFASYYHADAQLIQTVVAPADAWTIYVEDNGKDMFREGLGYHTVIGGIPTAYIYAKWGGKDWPLIFTHELFEMLADPYLKSFAHGWRWWLLEPADPVEDPQFAYKINGVTISDFVLPAWYSRRGKPPYDFTNSVKRRGQILVGGYAVAFLGGPEGFPFFFFGP